jgi:predicted nucleic acid-binding protein
VRFWDSSAVIPLLVVEDSSEDAQAEHARDIAMATWWGTQVECVSALARLEREDRLSANELAGGLGRLGQLAAGWVEVRPTERLRADAMRLLRVHALRAGDALQLAAARAAAEDNPPSLPFVTLDSRLALAASREGFEILAPAAHP